MKLNNKGFALTSIIYMLIVLFLMIMLLVLANLATRKVVLDKMKNDVKTNLNQGGSINSQDLPYQNITSGIYYETLELAFKHAKTGDTIKVLKDVEDISNPTLDQNKNVKLDIAGNKVNISNTITNNGTLDIYTSEDNGKIISSNLKSIKNLGTFSLNGTSSDHTLSIINSTTTKPSEVTVFENSAGTITLNKKSTITYDKESESGTAKRYIATNAGTIIVNGAILINNMDGLNTDHGLVNTSGNTNGSIIFNSGTIDTSGASLFNNGSTKNTTENPAIKVAGGTIRSSANYAIPNNITNSMIYITGGEISSTGNNTIQTAGNITMTGGTVYAYNGMGIYKYGSGNASISGGTLIKADNPITNTWVTGSTFQLNGNANGTITGTAVVQNNTGGGGSNVLYNNGTGNLTIEGNATIENKSSTLVGTNNNIGKIIVNGGTLKSGGSNIFTNSYASSTSTEYGTIEINGGTLQTSGVTAVQNTSPYGTIKVTGGTISTTGTSSSYGTIYNNKPNAKIEITGGTISGHYAIYNANGSNNSSITMTGGELSTPDDTAIYNRGKGATVTIGTIGATDNTYPKISGRVLGEGGTEGSGLITVNSGTITGTNSNAIRNTNDITINGGNISVSDTYTVISNSATSKITINGGNINITGGYYAVTTTNNVGGEIEINGGTIRSSTTYAAVNNVKGNTKITGGTIESSNSQVVYSETGEITVGTNDNSAPSQTVPNITGKTYGIYNKSGTTNFYDGKVTSQNGSGSSISGTVATPTGYTRKTVLNGTTETSTLGWATDSNDTQLVNDSAEYHVSRTSSEAANKVIKQYTINAPFAANEVYQVEFDMKGSGTMHTYFYGASGYWQVATTECLGETTTTGTDGNSNVALPGEYTHREIRFKLKPTGNANVNKYLLFRLNSGNADAYVKNIKFYKIN